MAQYKHLPIYKETYELLKLITERTKNYPRNFKYSLGDKIRNECVELVVFIFKANSTSGKERKDHIFQILERTQVIELLLRLSRDMNLLSIKHFAQIIEKTDSILKQATGWSKS